MKEKNKAVGFVCSFPIKKILISVIFGLIGFWANFHAVNFMQFADFKVSILFGLLFPLFITLMWGWKFGLLSALAGGCQTMWWLWFTDGWGFLYAVPVFTLWIVWHGYWADYRKTHEHRWYASIYIVEIPFRIVIELGFLTLFRLLVSFNPPPWAPQLTNNFVSISWVAFVAIKHTITAYVLLLICDVFMHIAPIRKFFNPEEKTDYRETTYIISAAVLIGCAFWFIQGIMDYFVFYKGQSSFLDMMFVHVPLNSLFSRNLFLLITLLVGVILSRIQLQLRKKDLILQEKNRERDKILNSIVTGLYIFNVKKNVNDYINTEYTAITGWTLEDINSMGASFFELFHPEERQQVMDHMAEVVHSTTDKVVMISYRFKTKNKTWKWLISYDIPFERDKHGNVTRFLGSFIDMTENVEAHKELEKYKEHLEEMVENRTKELEKRNKELFEFNKLFQGREYRIKELRDKVKMLKQKLEKYGTEKKQN